VVVTKGFTTPVNATMLVGGGQISGSTRDAAGGREHRAESNRLVGHPRRWTIGARARVHTPGVQRNV